MTLKTQIQTLQHQYTQNLKEIFTHLLQISQQNIDLKNHFTEIIIAGNLKKFNKNFKNELKQILQVKITLLELSSVILLSYGKTSGIVLNLQFQNLILTEISNFEVKNQIFVENLGLKNLISQIFTFFTSKTLNFENVETKVDKFVILTGCQDRYPWLLTDFLINELNEVENIKIDSNFISQLGIQNFCCFNGFLPKIFKIQLKNIKFNKNYIFNAFDGIKILQNIKIQNQM